MKRAWIIPVLALLAGFVSAQESSSFKLTESAFNQGGHPDPDDDELLSGAFRLSVHAVGQAVAHAPAGGAFSVDAGIPSAFRPPGEIENLLFLDDDLIAWDPDLARGEYHVYRGIVTRPPDAGFGACLLASLNTTSTGSVGTPGSSDIFFYLITARNRLLEESTKGETSSGAERPNPVPCP